MTKNDRKALFDTYTERVGIDLIVISGELIETMYLCRNTQAIVSNGQTYLPVQIELSKPEKGSEFVNASLALSGVDSTNIEMAQSLPPDAIVEVSNSFIFADAPDDVIDGPYFFTAESVQIESATGRIEIPLSVDSPLDYLVSQIRYDAEGFAAIWT